MKKIALIMAGGLAYRFWPRSTDKLPKQFIHLIGEGTLIQNTVMRLIPYFNIDEIYIITSEQYADVIENQLPLIPKENIILEPLSRNTSACIALAATLLSNKLDDDTIIMAFPSDHVIYNVREFHQSLDIAANIALETKGIVTIGITPSRPETAYGYIQFKNEPVGLDKYYEQGARYCTTFAEKPDVATAKRFVDSGDFLWNSGIFIWRKGTFLESCRKYLPEHYNLFEQLKKHIGKASYFGAVDYIYKQLQSVSVDYAILEKADNVYVIASTFNWSDLGTWDELYRLSRKDGRNNFIEGDVITVNSSNCFVNSNGKLIAMVGVDNLIVVDSDDAMLICRRNHSEDVKEIVDYLKRKNINKYL